MLTPVDGFTGVAPDWIQITVGAPDWNSVVLNAFW